MDERELKQGDVGELFAEKETKRGKKSIILVCGVIGTVTLAVIVCCVFFFKRDQGYQDYTVQMKQYYVEYSEAYDYWDVITVEYPYLEGIDEEVQGQLNTLMYDAAMDRVNYWHLDPSEDVKAYQEEVFSIFCSDVNCQATYQSQYLLSLDYLEWYSAGHPVWATNGTERTLMLDLVTGQSYELADILEINRDFARCWDKSLSDRLEEEYGDEEDLDILVSWFTQSDEELNEDFVCRPFFYLTPEKDFVIGVSLDPILWRAYTYEPVSWNFYARLSYDEIEPFKQDSGFWDKYEKSEPAGEVFPCEDKKENIWLGEDAGIWDYEY